MNTDTLQHDTHASTTSSGESHQEHDSSHDAVVVVPAFAAPVETAPAPANDAAVVALARPFALVRNAQPTEPEAPAQTAARCVLPAGWTFSGDVDAAGDVTVSGVMKGSILLSSPKSTLHVSELGSVDGQATGGNVKVDGAFTGEIDAAGARVEMGPQSRVTGSIKYSDIRMNGGRHELKNVQHVEAGEQS